MACVRSAYLKLAEDGGEVAAGRLAAEAEPFGELAIASAGGQQIEYLAFAGGQLWKPGRCGVAWRSRPALGFGTLPWYYESGLVSFGDPAVAIGPTSGPPPPVAESDVDREGALPIELQWSFCRSFHCGPLGVTGAYQLDDAPDPKQVTRSLARNPTSPSWSRA
jgi:hypothetical protein